MSAKLAKSKRYANLFQDESSKVYFFRKYSKIKSKQFFRSTGVKDNEARAYRVGLELFNDWLGKVADDSGKIYFSRYAKNYLRQKEESPTLSKGTIRTFLDVLEASPRSSGRVNEIPRPRLIDAFGHFTLDRITNEVWMRWVNEILKTYPGFKFFNSRKALIEILRNAVEQGHLARVPKFDNPDGEAAPPRELTQDEIRKLFKSCHYVVLNRGPNRTLAPVKRKDGKGVVREKNWIKLLLLIMWKQGTRPGEALQYEWAMIHFDEGDHGRIHIPSRIVKTRRARVIVLNASVSRVLKFLRPRAQGEFIFPSPGDLSRPIGNYHKTWQGVCRRAGFNAQIYWFRDTFVSRKLREGRNSIFIARYIDSSAVMLEKKYAVPSDRTMSEVAQ